MANTIQWTRRHGSLESRDSRFMIRADFMGTTRAQGYTLMDKLGRAASCDTVRQCKTEAQRRIDKDEKE